jgi:hypothetical protein
MAQLGDKVRDEVSGYEGIVLAKLEALYEASQCRVHPCSLSDQGQIRDSVWIEDDRLFVIKEQAIVGFRHVKGREMAEQD